MVWLGCGFVKGGVARQCESEKDSAEDIWLAVYIWYLFVAVSISQNVSMAECKHPDVDNLRS